MIRLDNIHIMRGFISFLTLLFLPLSALAQESLLFQGSHSPLEADYREMSVRPEETVRDAILANPAALNGLMNERRLFFNDNPLAVHRETPITVAVNGATGRMRGDFIPVTGNSFDDATVLANGHIRRERDILYGKAGFTTGKHRDIGWNILRSPETYWPYVVADSTGGDMGYETYNLMVAYSFGLSQNVDMGFSGEYTGDFAYRKTDPRIEDVASWLTVRGGLAFKVDSGSRLAFNVEYQMHRQHSEVKFFRSGQFAGFFTEYGFGMFDYIHSSIFNSAKNLMHQHSAGAAIQYSLSGGRPLRLNGRLAYGLDVMNTEENVYKLNLYRAMTNRLTANLSVLWSGNAWSLSFFGNATISQRKGREYIFERYVSDQVDGVDIYDYRKIGHNDRYTLRKVSADAQIKLSRYVGTSATLSLIGAADYFAREERYTENGYKFSNALLTPHVGLEITRTADALGARLTARYGHRTSLENKYSVNVDLDRHTEYQHAFSPYAYYSHEGNVLTIEGELSHAFRSVRVGLLARLMLVRADRLSSASYDSARYHEALPFASKHTVSLLPDVHNQHWAKFTFFVEL